MQEPVCPSLNLGRVLNLLQLRSAGLDDTLTVKSIGLSPSLERTLSTTKPIENLNGGVRDVTHRVKRWRGTSMTVGWVAAAGLVAAQATFRRLRGYKAVPKFVA